MLLRAKQQLGETKGSHELRMLRGAHTHSTAHAQVSACRALQAQDHSRNVHFWEVQLTLGNGDNLRVKPRKARTHRKYLGNFLLAHNCLFCDLKTRIPSQGYRLLYL